MVILAVGAHPDDIEFGCYATLAKLSEKHEIVFVICSAGELTGFKEARMQEAEASAKIINAKVEFLNYPDGNIPINSDSVTKLQNIIKKIEPDIIFTLSPNDTHQDHRAVSAITLSSSRYIPKIFYYEVPQTQNFKPNYFVDITDYFYFKEKALNCYLSQKNKPFLDIIEITGLSQYRAYQCFYKNRLFEAFEIVKIIEK